jgi:tRNA 2-thiouridine synthesizing protein C
MKNYLFVLRKPAHSGAYLAETLDMILTTAAFEQNVSLLFLDKAVFHLKQNQHVSFGADTAATFKALELYDVTALFVERESLNESGLTENDLFLPVTLISRQEINSLMQTFDVLISS